MITKSIMNNNSYSYKCVTPGDNSSNELCLFIKITHGYIQEGETLGLHLLMSLHFLLFTIYIIYKCLPNPND